MIDKTGQDADVLNPSDDCDDPSAFTSPLGTSPFEDRSHTPNIMPDTVNVTLQYLARDPIYEFEKPFQILVDLSHVEGARPTNHRYEVVKDVSITNVRSLEEQPTLDREGFQLEKLENLPHPHQFDSEAWIRDQYYPYVQQFLTKLLGAKEVRIFEHQVRTYASVGCSNFTNFDSYVTDSRASVLAKMRTQTSAQMAPMLHPCPLCIPVSLTPSLEHNC